MAQNITNTKVPWLAVTAFTAISFTLAWVVILPLWFADESSILHMILASFLPLAMMFTPLIATLFVVFVLKKPRTERLRFLGIWPLKPTKRILWFTGLATVVPAVIVLLALVVSVLFGWLHLDLKDFSGFQSTMPEPLPEELLPTLVITQIAIIPIAAIFNGFAAFGEEAGWRGWLLPTLMPLGTWPALLLSGAIWGLWHAPLTLLGHNFNDRGAFGILLMMLGAMAWGVLFGWTRLRTGSIWPAVIGHGSLNAAGGLVLLLGSAEAPMNMALVNPLGVSGWIVIALVVLILLVTGQFKREAGDPRRSQS